MLDLNPEYLQMTLEILQRHAPNAEAWAYGSRVTGQSHPGSDLDLVVRNPVTPDQPQARMGALREAFHQSNIPILVDVMDWASIPDSFRAAILENHVELRRPESPQR